VFGARRRADGTWDYMLDPKERIGYARVGGIRTGQTHYEFRDAMRSLRAAGVRGLVLDLRWCPGGYLNEATSIARLFLPESLPRGLPVARQRKRHGADVMEMDVEFEALDVPYADLPVVALINGETSGGGELIAAALQDHGRAAVAGQRTIGKGSIQEPMRQLRSNIPFRLTTGTFLRPTGKNLQRFPDSTPADDWGVRPDEGRDLPLTADAGARLKEWWTVFTLRPAGDTEALPLDDPENDPQRSAAVQMIREMTRGK
jgi:carboxyl-terminal processing protease